MTRNRCVICGNPFFRKPLLRYRNLPANAQYLPEKKSLKKDRGIALDVFQCSGCGLVQLTNDPVPYYREVIRASGFSPEMREFRRKQFRAFVGKHSLKGKKVIEIGCGKGEYLSIMKKQGTDAYGLEESEEARREYNRKGLKVIRGFIGKENYNITDGPFDAFFMMSFLEHLPDPNSTLRGIRNNLAEGAVGIVEVPNFDMVLRKNLFSEFMRDHLLYFTERTLRSTLEINGFEAIECKPVWHDYILSATVKKRGKLSLGHFRKQQEKLGRELNAYIERFGKGKVAVWGAGHQALAIIALAGIAKKIRYVVDSANFKQGRYTPATHVPIVAPKALEDDPVDAVIVMAASYSDEVAGIIRKKHGKGINIAIVRDFGLEGI